MNMTSPKPTGEYAVGTFTYSIMNQREEVLKPGTMRSISARVYYPTEKTAISGLPKSRHMSRSVTEGIRRAMYIPLNYDKMEASGTNVSECYEGAPHIEGKKFPLIMFHHGSGSYVEGNSFLLIELASQGYVVISVSHPMESAGADFNDGSSVIYEKFVTKQMYKPFIPAVIALAKLMKLKGTDEERAAKFDEVQRKYCKFLMGRLDEWVKDNDAAVDYAREHFTDFIDFSKGIGIAGHSMGGNTAYRLCTTNPDYVCGINIDGAFFGDYTGATLDVPFLQVSCKDNENVVSRVYLNQSAPVYKALFKDMRHAGFSDMKHAMKPGLTVGKLDPDKMHENMCHAFLEIFDTYLKKVKPELELKSNDTVTYTKFE